MNSMFIDIIRKLTAEQGKEALLNPSKCKAFLADYTKGEYRKESRLLLQAIDAGVQKEIITTVELELCKRQQIKVLQEEHFLSAEAAADIVETLALVLKEEQESVTPQSAFCSNCGKELQKEWGVCPYCGTTVKAQQNPPKAESPPLPSPVPAAQTAYPMPTAPGKKKHTVRNTALVIAGIILVIVLRSVLSKEASNSGQTTAPAAASANSNSSQTPTPAVESSNPKPAPSPTPQPGLEQPLNWKVTMRPISMGSKIAFGNNRFVAGGYGGEVAYSSDGLTWTAIEHSIYGDRETDIDIYDIAFGNDRFVAVGGSNHRGMSRMAYSLDGIAWKAVANTTFGGNAVLAIAFGNNRFVAVGYGGRIAYSSDGATWTAVANRPFDNKIITTIAFGNNRFVAGTWGKIAYSSDGVTWTVVPNSNLGDMSIYNMVYGNNRFVATLDYTKIMYSSDGITWTKATTNIFDNNNIRDIAFGNGRFVAVGIYGVTAYSSDGVTWTKSTIGDLPFFTIGFGNNRFIILSNDKIVYTE